VIGARTSGRFGSGEVEGVGSSQAGWQGEAKRGERRAPDGCVASHPGRSHRVPDASSWIHPRRSRQCISKTAVRVAAAILAAVEGGIMPPGRGAGILGLLSRLRRAGRPALRQAGCLTPRTFASTTPPGGIPLERGPRGADVRGGRERGSPVGRRLAALEPVLGLARKAQPSGPPADRERQVHETDPE